MCPKGDDPFTPSTGYRSIILTTSVKNSLSNLGGEFRFSFYGETFFFPPTGFDETDCRQSFNKLNNVELVDCTIIATTAKSISYKVQFLKFPPYPFENNVLSLNDGNPPLSSFSCSSDLITGTTSNKIGLSCTVSDTDTDKIIPGKT